MKFAAILAALALARAPLAAAQPPSAGDPEAAIAPELVVTAAVRGPAWWRVSQGNSVVWILGAPGLLPKHQVWDTTALERHLSAAHAVIFPAVSSAGLFDLPALLSLRGQMRASTPLEQILPPALGARFAADARALGRDARHYDGWNGLYAGLIMLGDLNRRDDIAYGEPLPTIERLARAHGLKPRPVAVYKGVPILRAASAELTPAIEQDCLAEALDEVEGGATRRAEAADGWARGDVKTALRAAPGFGHCINLLPEGALIARRGMADEASAISAALKTPGVTVAVVMLRPLLAQGGVLEQLRAQGVEIRAPNKGEGG
jgi:uncharacterized protein YbaP (TraB family)